MITSTHIQNKHNLITHRASLLVKPIPPNVQWFLEYQYKDNPNLAYCLPCTQEGTITQDIIDNMSDRSLDLYYHMAERDDEYKETGVHKAESGGLPMIFVCTCGTITKFPRYEEPEVTCLGCYTPWTWSSVLNLPMAERNTIPK